MTSKQVEEVFLTEEKHCPYGLCGGTGLVEEGEFDDLHIKPCLCAIDLRDNDDQYE